MAISATHYRILRELHAKGLLPQHGDILEIGQANWYGDMPINEIREDRRKIHAINNPDAGFYDEGYHAHYAFTGQTASDIVSGREGKGPDPFKVVKIIYEIFFQTGAIDSIDQDPNAKGAIPHDLNEPINLGRLYNVVYNHGTAEHVGNVGQVFKTMHDHCRVGGLLISEGPMTGWRNHSLYALRPAFWFGLPRANGYEILGVWTQHFNSQTAILLESEEHAEYLDNAGQLPGSGMALAVYRKTKDEPFKYPTQSHYDGAATPFMGQRWGSPLAR